MKKGKVFLIPVFLFLLAITSFAPLYSEEIAASSQNNEDPSKKPIASVNNVPIILKQAQNRAELISREASYHGRISDEKKQELMEKALDQLIIEELVYQEAKKTAVSVSEKEVDIRLNEIKKGFSSEELFNKSLTANNIDLNSYKKLIEREMLIKKINAKMFGTPIKLSDKEVRDYFEKNREKFKEPERIRLRQILIKVPAYASKEEWEKGGKKAEEIHAELKAGKDFAKLAKEFSNDPSREKGGDMGFIHKGRLEPYIEDIAYSMKAGEISGVLQTIYGYHIIKLEEKRPPQDTPFSRIKKKLKKDLEGVAMEDKKKDWVKELRKKADIKYYAPSDKKD